MSAFIDVAEEKFNGSRIVEVYWHRQMVKTVEGTVCVSPVKATASPRSWGWAERDELVANAIRRQGIFPSALGCGTIGKLLSSDTPRLKTTCVAVAKE